MRNKERGWGWDYSEASEGLGSKPKATLAFRDPHDPESQHLTVVPWGPHSPCPSLALSVGYGLQAKNDGGSILSIENNVCKESETWTQV